MPPPGKGRIMQQYVHQTPAKVERTTTGNPKKQECSKEMVQAIIDWSQDLIMWGQTVRDDIIRLEAASGIDRGDPGDPPPPPWE